jgi:hypothetical protein
MADRVISLSDGLVVADRQNTSRVSPQALRW